MRSCVRARHGHALARTNLCSSRASNGRCCCCVFAYVSGAGGIICQVNGLVQYVAALKTARSYSRKLHLESFLWRVEVKMTNLSDVGPTTTTASICQFLLRTQSAAPITQHTHNCASHSNRAGDARPAAHIPIESSAAGGSGFRLHACAPARSG